MPDLRPLLQWSDSHEYAFAFGGYANIAVGHWSILGRLVSQKHAVRRPTTSLGRLAGAWHDAIVHPARC